MKRLTLLIIFFFSLTALKAQSAEETLEWLNIKKDEMYIGGCKSNTVGAYSGNNVVEITAAHIKVSNDKGAYTRADWPTIKEVKKEGLSDLQIVCNFNYDNKPSFITLVFKSQEIRDKYMKAIKHMATLKGAKMIDSDLF